MDGMAYSTRNRELTGSGYNVAKTHFYVLA